MKCLHSVYLLLINFLLKFKIEEASDDEGEGDKPLTMEEFMQKAMMKIESTKTTINKQTKKSSMGKSKRK